MPYLDMMGSAMSLCLNSIEALDSGIVASMSMHTAVTELRGFSSIIVETRHTSHFQSLPQVVLRLCVGS